MIVRHNSDVGLAFYNDRVKEIIAADIIAEPFTYVPIKAGHQELVGGNAMIFGKITEGYDVIEIDVAHEITFEDVSLNNPTIDLALQYLQLADPVDREVPEWSGIAVYYKDDIVTRKYGTEPRYVYRAKKAVSAGIDPSDISSIDYWLQLGRADSMTFRRVRGFMRVTLPLTVVAGASYNVTIKNTEEGIADMTASYTAQLSDIYTTVISGLLADMTAKGFEFPSYDFASNSIIFYPRFRFFMNTPTYEAGGIKEVFKYFTPPYGGESTAYILTYGNTIKYSILKCGAKHQFGIVYKDRANRTCSVIKCDEMSVYIPFYAEDMNNVIGSIAKVLFKIYHTPPDWAETYEIVYFGNVSMDYFLQMRANDITEIPGSSSKRFSMNIQETFEWTWDHNNRWKVPPYVWQSGDRVRLIGTVDENDGTVYGLYSGEAIGGEFLTSPYDYEIEATGTQYNEEAIGGDWLIFQAVQKPIPFAGETNILVEVYRPRRGLAQMVAYGTGMVFDIGIDANGYRYHKGDVDQVFNGIGSCITPAEVNNTANDCWKYYRLNYKFESTIIQPFWAESIFPSDWWGGQIMENRLTSCGFPFLDDLSQRQMILPERFRFGGALIEGTRTNNIAHFTYLNFRDLQQKNGPITGMRETGYTVNMVQLYKETSVYINRVQTFNPDGTSQFTLTNTFIGDMRPLDTNYGCQHPDSIVVNGRNLYYWDNSEGVFIRSAPNGQIVLDVKMKRWFKDLVRWIQANGGRDVLETRTGANNDHNEVWVTFRMRDEVRGLIFSEKNGRYISEITQITETYIHLGNFFAHLYRQALWIMNIDEGQAWLYWNGEPTYADIEVVSNIDSIKNKVFNAVGVVADHLLQSLSKFVHIPREGSAVGELMESNIPILERKEGIYYGQIMKDENSKGNFDSVFARKLNGRAMRGRYCYVKFRSEEHTEKVRIDSITIFSTPSERNI